MDSKLIKGLYIIFAFISLGLGVLGVILPVLPTTPFLLLASYFFAKGSDRFYIWFKSTKIYKNHVEEFIKTRAMTLKKKLSILLPVSTMLILTFILIDNKHARIVIPLVIILKYYYFFFHIETIKEELVREEKLVLNNKDDIKSWNYKVKYIN